LSQLTLFELMKPPFFYFTSDKSEVMGSVVNDAKTRFPKVKLNDAKNARDVRINVLVDHGIYSKEQATKLTDAEIRAAYAGLVATSAKKNSAISSLLNDSQSKQTKSASARLGGK